MGRGFDQDKDCLLKGNGEFWPGSGDFLKLRVSHLVACAGFCVTLRAA
jgi:hypothetical protein